MAKNISLLGADYPDVPAVQLPQTGGGTATFYDVEVTDGDPTLAWSTRSKVGTVNGTDLHVTMPANPVPNLTPVEVSSLVTPKNTTNWQNINSRFYRVGNIIVAHICFKLLVAKSAGFSEEIFEVDDSIKPKYGNVWVGYPLMVQNVNNGNIEQTFAYLAGHNKNFYARSSNSIAITDYAGFTGNIVWTI